jgi:hypothetical protein
VTDRTALLARLSSAVASATAEELPGRLCEASQGVLGADGASITVASSTSNRLTLGATDATASQIEDLHDVLGQGPFMDAFRTGLPVVSALDSESDRWPVFTEAVLRKTPAAALVGLPMRTGSTVLGVLGLYLTGRHTLAEPVESALVLADALCAALVHDPALYAEDLNRGPWASRAVVHQATGMVVAQLHVPVNDALALLRAHAFLLDVELGVIAQAVLDGDISFRLENPT